jgi:hypothetical protein
MVLILNYVLISIKVILSTGFILVYSVSLGEAILNHSNPTVPHTPVGGSRNFIF